MSVEPEPREPVPAPEPRRHGFFRELFDTVVPAVAIVLVINLFLAQPRVVHGESMEPNLHQDERLIIDLITYRFRAPERGEIIVLDLHDHSEPLIKRVVGLPGETVEIKRGAVYINGTKLDEPYLDQMTFGDIRPQVVPEDHVFVLGDNRGSSNDSRYFGMVSYDSILGRAWLRYWPPQDIGVFG